LLHKGAGVYFHNTEIGDSRMNEKQALLTILGGMIFAVFGGLLLFARYQSGFNMIMVMTALECFGFCFPSCPGSRASSYLLGGFANATGTM